MATTQELISYFEEYVDDTTELSPAQELALANKIYRRVLNDRPWEFLKKEYNTTTNGGDITLPADFANFASNHSFTDHAIEQGGKYVFIGDTLIPYQIVNWSDRKQYRNIGQKCWLNVASNTLSFSVQPDSGLAVTFDYIYRPADLTLVTSPIFPSDFHDIIYHGMAADDYMIQQFDKARSYAQENEANYRRYLDDLALYNSNLISIVY